MKDSPLGEEKDKGLLLVKNPNAARVVSKGKGKKDFKMCLPSKSHMMKKEATKKKNIELLTILQKRNNKRTSHTSGLRFVLSTKK